MTKIWNPRNIVILDNVRGVASKKMEGSKIYWLKCIAYAGRAWHRSNMNAVYIWECDCGSKIYDYAKEVRGGRSKSCGCHHGQPRRNVNDAHPRAKMWRDFWGKECKK